MRNKYREGIHMNQRIGDIISQNRQNKGMTQEEFASRLGVTPQAVSKWERGNGMPDISLIQGICQVLDISANMLLGIQEHRVVENDNVAWEKEICNQMFAEPLAIEFSIDVVPCFVEGLKTDFVNKKRLELVKETGMLMPLLRIRDNKELKPLEVRILSYDKVLWNNVLDGLAEDTYEMLITQVVTECRNHYDTILNKSIVKSMLDNISNLYPGVIDDFIPEKVSYLQVLKKLQSVVREQGNIRNMIYILEELESGAMEKK